MLSLASPAQAAKVSFSRDIVPILSTSCFPCHGPDANKRKADLRLDVRDSALSKRDGHPAIVPGQPSQSELIARIARKDAAHRMPPPRAGSALTSEQIQLLRAWIEQGAEYTEHWAFVPPRRPAAPPVQKASWPQTPIDAFVLQRLAQQGLKPAPRASREVLIRRATFDLTGLPPTPAEIQAFVTDDSPTAYARLIDRLLESPHYGERWGRHWLDVARYADSGGFETDIFYANAWRYRDYVLRSFNADKPFDQFVREQIAGDELYPHDRAALLATALYTIGPVLEEAGMVAGKLDYDWLTDAVDTTGSAFLGLTMGCARCHDHKYDPIAQRDYYGLQAIFAQSDLFDFNPDGTVLKGHVALKKTEKEFLQAQSRTEPRLVNGDPYPEIPLRGLAHRDQPLEIRLLHRGELNAPGDRIEPGLPATLARGKASGELPAGVWRTALAHWIASAQNPLTVRVIVNRIWQWHFGQGLVRTPNDFGTRGERPTHPELLDWLAVEFVERGWSFKHLHRLILLSSSYQMSSQVDRETLRLDPDNRLLTRFQPRRLEAEAIWDSVRAVAGTLNPRMYGLPVAPPLDPREQIGNYKKWPTSTPEESQRRAVYLLVKRSFRFPALGAFDLPENVFSCGQRDTTVIPNQALTLLNNRTIQEQARTFAERLLRETQGDLQAVPALAWSHAYGRRITPEEHEKVAAFFQAQGASASADRRKKAVEDFCLALFNTNEFIYLP
jgi:hypothetical protein